MDKTVCELFAGVGGFRCGLNHIHASEEIQEKDNNWNTVWFSQWEPADKKTQWAHGCYVYNFGTCLDVDGNDTTNINIEDLNITKDYIYGISKKDNIEKVETDKIIYKDIYINDEIVSSEHASKTINGLLTKEEQEKLDYGTFMHKIFETTDFLNISDNNVYKNQINRFVEKLNITKNTKIYKEHEFIFNYGDITYHGIIDLVLIEDNVIKIVDYKLKNIDDPKYINQLEVYYKYLKSIFNKDIKTYLYSIIDDELKLIF